MRLFHSPGSCSDGIQIILEEIEADYEIEIVDVTKGMQRASSFLETNPKGKVPALLRDDGSVLTEFQAIACWLAQECAQGRLWPGDPETQCRTLEALDFIVGSVHMRGFTFVKVPQKFQLDEKGTRDLRDYGRKEVTRGLRNLEIMLGESPYLLGHFGIADAALFYVLQWAEKEDFSLAANLRTFLDRMRDRPSVEALTSR